MQGFSLNMRNSKQQQKDDDAFIFVAEEPVYPIIQMHFGFFFNNEKWDDR
jgi:hypothetical protein